MKKVFTLLVFFLCVFCYANEICNMQGLSYTQRGILEIDGNEDMVNIYVKASKKGTLMQMDSTFGTFCKLGVDNDGAIFLLEAQIPFKEDWVREYVYRDFLIILGIKNFTEDENYIIQFSDLKNLENLDKKIPEKIFIKDKNYSLKLNLLNVKKKQ